MSGRLPTSAGSSALRSWYANAAAGPSRPTALLQPRKPLRRRPTTSAALNTSSSPGPPAATTSTTAAPPIDWLNPYKNVKPDPERSIVFQLPSTKLPNGHRTSFKYERHKAAVEARKAEQTNNIELIRRQRADPFIVMARSATKRCGVTRVRLPKHYTINLIPVHSGPPGPTQKTFIMPDQLLSDRRTRLGGASSVTCRKALVDRLHKNNRGLVKLLHNYLGPFEIPTRLSAMIEDQLERRIVSETEALQRGMDLLRSQAKPARCVQLADPDDFPAALNTDAGPNIRAFIDLRDAPEAQVKTALEQEKCWPLTMRDRTPIPTYFLARLMPADRFDAMKQALAKAANVPVEQCTGIALSTWPAWSPNVYGVQLAIAMWRLRCWHGHGWKESLVHPRAKR